MAKFSDNNNILEIIKNIQQIVYNSSDIPNTSDREKIGLKREKGNQILDSRIMDGFNVSIINDLLKINYQSDIRLKDVYETNKFEGEIEQIITDIISYIKKEYKRVTGETLTLTPIKDTFKVLVQSTSRVRSWVEASCYYRINNINISNEDKYMKNYEEKFKEWIKQSEKKPLKSKNITI